MRKAKSSRTRVFSVDVMSEYGVNLANRTMFLSGDIDVKHLDKVLGGLELLDREGQLITVKMFSFGGLFYEGLGIFDALRSCKSEVQIIGYGAIMSMATVILQAADPGKRILMPNATLMMHQGMGGSDYDHPEQVRRQIDEYDRIRNRAFSIVSERMGITLKQFNTRFRFDKYYDAEEAVALKVADSVLPVT